LKEQKSRWLSIGKRTEILGVGLSEIREMKLAGNSGFEKDMSCLLLIGDYGTELR